jgi:F-type H+-transporting ATPase subunit delta
MKSVSPKNLAHVLLESENLSIKDFVAFLAKNKMLKSADEIIKQYEILYNIKHNTIEATVTVAEALSEHKNTELRHALKEKYKANAVHLIEKIDERLIGGIKIQVGDTVFDSSIRNTLRQLETQLLK